MKHVVWDPAVGLPPNAADCDVIDSLFENSIYIWFFWIRYHLRKYMEHIMWRFRKYEQNMFGEKCVRSSRLTPIILWRPMWIYSPHRKWWGTFVRWQSCGICFLPINVFFLTFFFLHKYIFCCTFMESRNLSFFAVGLWVLCRYERVLECTTTTKWCWWRLRKCGAECFWLMEDR